ncbi:hypothetical protein AMAG_17802 [Allomyces macrogynus ATCC 38327]|uniref:FHA domain-containing protein n=1 Tax=Allomyces macrogynus (strain ATCC 38327) TaxID=578462 RepID=A0A0L0RZZ0_ALLM3|nr:hypothetical protein AMAG_17802 [Allomyces macrogynus ATCC 38327]|eukprot:KNE55676.1 hypothetical protein AMAG_17802 [Allomyces macrogynus ATCC 38327]
MPPTRPRTPTRAVVVLGGSPEADYVDIGSEHLFHGSDNAGLGTMASDDAMPPPSDDADPFRSSSGFARRRGSPDASSITIAPARLVLLPAAGSRGPERILPLLTDRTVATVGSAPDQDVRVQLPFVAPQQCRIRFSPATGAMTLENLSDTRVTITTFSLPASPAVTNPAPVQLSSLHAVARGTTHPVRHNDIITIGDPSSTAHSRQFRLEQVRPSSPLIGTSPLPLSTAPTRAPIESPIPPTTTVLSPPPPETPARTAPVPSTPKSVRFGPALRPEIFDAEEPPSSPLVRGELVAVPALPAGPSTPRPLSTPGKGCAAETTPRSILKKRVQRIRLVSPAKFRSPAGNAMWRAAAAAGGRKCGAAGIGDDGAGCCGAGKGDSGSCGGEDRAGSAAAVACACRPVLETAAAAA